MTTRAKLGVESSSTIRPDCIFVTTSCSSQRRLRGRFLFWSAFTTCTCSAPPDRGSRVLHCSGTRLAAAKAGTHSCHSLQEPSAFRRRAHCCIQGTSILAQRAPTQQLAQRTEPEQAKRWASVPQKLHSTGALPRRHPASHDSFRACAHQDSSGPESSALQASGAAPAQFPLTRIRCSRACLCSAEAHVCTFKRAACRHRPFVSASFRHAPVASAGIGPLSA